MNRTDSRHYGNAYEKHEDRKGKLKELSEKYQSEALLKLASTLEITPEGLLRILAGVQGINPLLGRGLTKKNNKSIKIGENS